MSRKFFSQKALVRILLNVDKTVAIGSIIEAKRSLNVNQEKELNDLADALISNFLGFLPEKVVNLLTLIFPKFFRVLKIYLGYNIFRYLQLLPGDVFYAHPPDTNPDDVVGDIDEGKEEIAKLQQKIDQLQIDLTNSQNEVSNLRSSLRRVAYDVNATLKELEGSRERHLEAAEKYPVGDFRRSEHRAQAASIQYAITVVKRYLGRWRNGR